MILAKSDVDSTYPPGNTLAHLLRKKKEGKRECVREKKKTAAAIVLTQSPPIFLGTNFQKLFPTDRQIGEIERREGREREAMGWRLSRESKRKREGG